MGGIPTRRWTRLLASLRREASMAVVHFGKIYACSRCPGWQTDDGNTAVTHQSQHMVIDMSRGICPTCIQPAKKLETGGVVRFLPCGHSHKAA